MIDSEWIKRQRHLWTYRIVGPTTLHYKHEFYLLVSLSLLTVSSLQALYKQSFGLRGDYHLILLSTIWLSRYLILRWLCTWDISTSRSPTLFGVLSHWITSHVMAGQYFDRPNPMVVAKQIGTQYSEDARGNVTFSSFFHPSLNYTWQLLKVRVFYPLLRFHDKFIKSDLINTYNSESFGKSASPQHISRREKSPPVTSPRLTKAYTIWTTIWTMYGPPTQMIISVATMAYYLWHLNFETSSPPQTSQALTMNTQNSQSQELGNFDSKPYGAYRQLDRPQWQQVLFFLSCGGTLSSVYLYGRVFLPLADLVAGSNVLKAVRTEARLYGSHLSSSVR